MELDRGTANDRGGDRADDHTPAERPTFALLPSPLVGPSVWGPVAILLREQGHQVVVVPRSPRAPSGPADVLDHMLSALPAHRQLLVVAHSNAGAYVPGLVHARPGVAGMVFADAMLPPAAGRVALSPPATRARLEELAIDGVLPPWTDWFDDAVVAGLFPDEDTRHAVAAEQHRLPLAYFEQSVEVPPGWDRRPAAYLAFGSTYHDEIVDARRRGWPVQNLPGHHLHMLVAPDLVTAAILDLLDHARP